jgi:hypothetical protein
MHTNPSSHPPHHLDPLAISCVHSVVTERQAALVSWQHWQHGGSCSTTFKPASLLFTLKMLTYTELHKPRTHRQTDTQTNRQTDRHTRTRPPPCSSNSNSGYSGQTMQLLHQGHANSQASHSCRACCQRARWATSHTVCLVPPPPATAAAAPTTQQHHHHPSISKTVTPLLHLHPLALGAHPGLASSLHLPAAPAPLGPGGSPWLGIVPSSSFTPLLHMLSSAGTLLRPSWQLTPSTYAGSAASAAAAVAV